MAIAEHYGRQPLLKLHVGDAANSWQSLEIMGQPDELTGIKQKVYLPVHRVLVYKVSLYAKHISGPEILRMSFRDRSTGKVFAESKVRVPASEWMKYSTTLELKQGAVRRLEPVDFCSIRRGRRARLMSTRSSLLPADAIGNTRP